MKLKKTLPLFITTILFVLIASGIKAQVIKGTYAIQNVSTGMYLRVKDANNKNGTPLVAYSPVNWKCVTWDFKHVDGQTYQLQNLFTSKTFQPVNASATEGIALEQQPLNTSTAIQQYEFIAVQKDVYLIRLKGSDLYVTPADKNGEVNSKIILAKKDNSKLQQWTLHEQEPTM